MTDKRRTYTKEFKIEAVRMVERTGSGGAQVETVGRVSSGT